MKLFMNKGFTSIEVLLSLFIVSFSVLLLSSSLQSIHRLIHADSFIQEQIGLRQIRHLLLLSEDITLDDHSLNGLLYNEAYTLTFDRQRLIKTPGYEILLTELASADFKKEGECVYLVYQKNNASESVERLLACKQKGVDFTLFPDADADDAFSDPADEYTDQNDEAAGSN